MLLWMTGYLVAGAAAIICFAVYSIAILPFVCKYEADEWCEFFVGFLEGYASLQSKLDNCSGWLYTIFLWPLKIIWLFCHIIPHAVNMYEAQFEKD